MAIVEKKEFTKGMILTISFLIVLVIIYSPVFKGKNGLEASDDLFNSIAKGSTYYIPGMIKKSKAFMGKEIGVTIRLSNTDIARKTGSLFSAAGAAVSQDEAQLTIKGDLGKILAAALQDSDDMFNNKGAVLREKYGYDPKEAMYNWWLACKLIDKALKKQKRFKEAKFVTSVRKKAVETGYNFYGIEAEKASKRAGILSSVLIFYVVYTMWWGFSVFFLFEGIGLKMEAAKEKKEV
ncbi:MAG: hypothetical protein DRH43_04655 [Deltaproteobacteria bacterium]|nr:MAG: hypothetical protein DRH50_07135 [Deltaproteobacteria bacterium]RLC11211.1 MAG: hypothetical protein DRH43_04655 [Deltaproteobacteria bacterium]